MRSLQETKIAVLIAAFDIEHGRVQVALKDLNADIAKASRVLIDLQGLSLWRAALQHLAAAVAATVVTLLGVWWYVPSLSDIDITARRAEREQLQASIETLNVQGARLHLSECGSGSGKKRLCVLVPKKPMMWDDLNDRSQAYVVPVGY